MRSVALLPYLLGIALLTAFIETDISVPGFPEMVKYFNTTEAMVQLTMSLNFLGFCLAGLIYGPLSDSYGRRPIMLLGNFIFFIGAIGTATATDIHSLIAWRFFQGLGASAACIVAFAMVADAYQGEKASKLLNRMNACLTAAMAGAPLAGGFLVDAYGWRSSYIIVAILCAIATFLLLMFLPETNPNKQPFEPKQIAKDFYRLLTDADFMALTIGLTLQCAGYMAFVAGAVFVYLGRFELSLAEFTLHQGCVITAFSVISFLGDKINRLLSVRRSMEMGIVLNVLGGLSIWMLAIYGSQNAYFYTLSMSIYSIGVALCYGVTFTASMELFPTLKGAASSMNMSIRLLIIALVIGVVGSFADGTFVPETSLLILCALVSACLFTFVAARPKVRPLLA